MRASADVLIEWVRATVYDERGDPLYWWENRTPRPARREEEE